MSVNSWMWVSHFLTNTGVSDHANTVEQCRQKCMRCWQEQIGTPSRFTAALLCRSWEHRQLQALHTAYVHLFALRAGQLLCTWACEAYEDAQMHVSQQNVQYLFLQMCQNVEYFGFTASRKTLISQDAATVTGFWQELCQYCIASAVFTCVLELRLYVFSVRYITDPTFCQSCDRNIG